MLFVLHDDLVVVLEIVLLVLVGALRVPPGHQGSQDQSPVSRKLIEFAKGIMAN